MPDAAIAALALAKMSPAAAAVAGDEVRHLMDQEFHIFPEQRQALFDQAKETIIAARSAMLAPDAAASTAASVPAAPEVAQQGVTASAIAAWTAFMEFTGKYFNCANDKHFRSTDLNEVPFVEVMFRFLVVLSLLSLGSGLVLTDKAEPKAEPKAPAAKESKEDSVALAAETQSGEKEATEGTEATAGEEAEDKEEIEQIKKQDAEGNQISEADRKELEETMKDEKVTSGSEDAESDENELPDSSPEVIAEEKAAAAVQDADSDEAMDATASDEDTVEAVASDANSDAKSDGKSK